MRLCSPSKLSQLGQVASDDVWQAAPLPAPTQSRFTRWYLQSMNGHRRVDGSSTVQLVGWTVFAIHQLLRPAPVVAASDSTPRLVEHLVPGLILVLPFWVVSVALIASARLLPASVGLAALTFLPTTVLLTSGMQILGHIIDGQRGLAIATVGAIMVTLVLGWVGLGECRRAFYHNYP